MPDDPSRGGRTADSESGVDDAGSVASVSERTPSDSVGESDPSQGSSPTDDGEPVDGAVQRRLRDAYLNDEESALIVTAVRSAAAEIVVEFRPPHGEATHVERFPAPRDGSLSESEAFLEFLSAAGVSPLDVDELVGAEVPATYDAETGWRIDDAYAVDRESDTPSSVGWGRSVSWLRENRYWLLAGALIAGELLFVVAIILLYA